MFGEVKINTLHYISILKLSRVHCAYITVCNTRHIYIKVYYRTVL